MTLYEGGAREYSSTHS